MFPIYEIASENYTGNFAIQWKEEGRRARPGARRSLSGGPVSRSMPARVIRHTALVTRGAAALHMRDELQCVHCSPAVSRLQIIYVKLVSLAVIQSACGVFILFNRRALRVLMLLDCTFSEHYSIILCSFAIIYDVIGCRSYLGKVCFGGVVVHRALRVANAVPRAALHSV